MAPIAPPVPNEAGSAFHPCRLLLVHRARDDIAKELPTVSVKSHEPKLLDWGKIGRAGVDRDTRQQDPTGRHQPLLDPNTAARARCD